MCLYSTDGHHTPDPRPKFTCLSPDPQIVNLAASFILTDAVKADGRLCPNPRREIPDASSDPLAHLRLCVQIWLQKLTLGLGPCFIVAQGLYCVATTTREGEGSVALLEAPLDLAVSES